MQVMAMITNAAHPETFIHAGMESPTRTLSFVSSTLVSNKNGRVKKLIK